MFNQSIISKSIYCVKYISIIPILISYQLITCGVDNLIDVAYIDIKSAFDSVDRVALWKGDAPAIPTPAIPTPVLAAHFSQLHA